MYAAVRETINRKERKKTGQEKGERGQSMKPRNREDGVTQHRLSQSLLRLLLCLRSNNGRMLALFFLLLIMLLLLLLVMLQLHSLLLLLLSLLLFRVVVE